MGSHDPESWFHDALGFEELPTYAENQRELQRRSTAPGGAVAINGRRVGEWRTPSVAELRTEALAGATQTGLVGRRVTLRNVAGDIADFFAAPMNAGSVFQAASQFNCLEAPDPDSCTPENGITGYCWDRTQGPVCAMCCAASAAYRNYLVPIKDRHGQPRLGQSAKHQINNLADLHEAMGGKLWQVRNGYVEASKEGLQRARQLIRSGDASLLRDKLRIGLHLDAEVTTPGVPPGQLVAQAMCAAAAVGYSERPSAEWEPLARLILEASYEATLWAAVLYAARRRQRRMQVYLTKVGGGVFGNEAEWIIDAIRHACDAVQKMGIGLDVRVVHYGYIEEEYAALKEVEVAPQLVHSIAQMARERRGGGGEGRGRSGAAAPLLAVEEVEAELGKEGVLEGKDAMGGWWPITVTRRTGKKTFTAEVHDRQRSKWPRVHVANIRLAADGSTRSSRAGSWAAHSGQGVPDAPASHVGEAGSRLGVNSPAKEHRRGSIGQQSAGGSSSGAEDRGELRKHGTGSRTGAVPDCWNLPLDITATMEQAGVAPPAAPGLWTERGAFTDRSGWAAGQASGTGAWTSRTDGTWDGSGSGMAGRTSAEPGLHGGIQAGRHGCVMPHDRPGSRRDKENSLNKRRTPVLSAATEALATNHLNELTPRQVLPDRQATGSADLTAAQRRRILTDSGLSAEHQGRMSVNSGHAREPGERAALLTPPVGPNAAPTPAPPPGCMLCGRPWNWMRRRYVCRSCESEVCDSCSKSKRALDHAGFPGPERVCDACRAVLDDDVEVDQME